MGFVLLFKVFKKQRIYSKEVNRASIMLILMNSTTNLSDQSLLIMSNTLESRELTPAVNQ